MPTETTTPTRLPLGSLTESPTNPRKGKDAAALEELAASISAHGVLQPLVVRVRKDGRYEIVAGHRRFWAAHRAGLEAVPVVVHELTDDQAREVQLVENLQRADMHPLHEAAGYRELVTQSKLDVARIAERIGRTPQYVYDRLRLLDLSAESRKLFFAGKFTLGHAILLARLSEADQARALDPSDQHALWEHDVRLWNGPEEAAENDENERDPLVGMKAGSVKRLQAWIDRRVRLDPRAEDVPTLFPMAAQAVAQVEAEPTGTWESRKLIALTTSQQLHPDARGDSGRTWGPMSWKRAGELGADPECEHAVLGVIVVGAGRGDAFPVCTAKKTCKVHWAAEIRDAARREKARVSDGQDSEKFKELERKQREARERMEAERARYAKASDQLFDAFEEALKRIPVTGAGPLGDLVLARLSLSKAERAKLKTAEDIVRHLAMEEVADELRSSWRASEQVPALGKLLGVDVKAILDEHAPLPKAESAAPAKKAAKKKAKR